MNNISYDFKEGQLVRLFHGVPDAAWLIYQAPTEELRAAITWNDANGDFEELERVDILEVFIVDFIRG
jgi:hypothetical protein